MGNGSGDRQEVATPLLRRIAFGDALKILAIAVLVGGYIWEIRSIKAELVKTSETVGRLEKQLIELNAMLSGKIRESDMIHGLIERRGDDQEQRLRALEREDR